MLALRMSQPNPMSAQSSRGCAFPSAYMRTSTDVQVFNAQRMARLQQPFRHRAWSFDRAARHGGNSVESFCLCITITG